MRVLVPSTLLLAASLVACGGDSTGPSGSPAPQQPRGISAAEATAIGRAVLAPGVGVAQTGVSGTSQSSAPAGDIAADNGSIPFGFTAPCQPSGSVGVSGSLSAAWDFVRGLAVVHAQVALRHNACTVQTDVGPLTVTGDPAVDLTLTAAGDATGLKAVLITQTGAITWLRPDGSSGRCEARVAGVAIAGTPNYHVSGTVCGTSIDFTGPL